jgi:hypothetical protein
MGSFGSNIFLYLGETFFAEVRLASLIIFLYTPGRWQINLTCISFKFTN